MNTTQDQAFKRLLKKLSAMRATLKNDEREILDEIVTGEAVAHRLRADAATTAAKSAAKEVVAHRLRADAVTPAAKSAAKEVVAHRLKADAVTPAAKSAAKEVAAHMQKADQVVPAANRAHVGGGGIRAIGRNHPRIDIDPDSGKYFAAKD